MSNHFRGLAVFGLLLIAIAAAAAGEPLPGYDAELASLEAQIAVTSGGGELVLLDPQAALERATRRAFLVYRKASLTTEYPDFQAAEKAIAAAIATVGPSEDLYFLEASFHFKLHRLAAARAALAKAPDLAGEARYLAFAADLAYQEGRYAEAERGYLAALRKNRSWDNLARLAYYRSRTGQPKEADRLYREAQDQLTAKEMRSWAWVELQRGLLELDFGHPDAALAHYRRADAAYPGWFLVEEHVAEALGRLGRTDEAIALYRRILEKKRSPEFLGALAALAEARDPDEAKALGREAGERFAEQSVLYPEAALGHYLEHRLGRGAPDEELLAMARRNVELRPNGDARLLLARAFLALGRPAEARGELAAILATPWRMPALAEAQKALERESRAALAEARRKTAR